MDAIDCNIRIRSEMHYFWPDLAPVDNVHFPCSRPGVVGSVRVNGRDDQIRNAVPIEVGRGKRVSRLVTLQLIRKAMPDSIDDHVGVLRQVNSPGVRIVLSKYDIDDAAVVLRWVRAIVARGC